LNSRWTTTTMSASDALVGWPSRAHLLSPRPASPVDPPPTQTPTSIDSALATPVSSLQHSHVVCTHTLNISAALYILLYSHKLQLQKQEIKKQRKKRHKRERERVYFPYSKNTWTSTQQKCKIRRVARKALGPSKLATHNVSKSTTCQMHTNYAERKRKIT